MEDMRNVKLEYRQKSFAPNQKKLFNRTNKVYNRTYAYELINDIVDGHNYKEYIA